MPAAHTGTEAHLHRFHAVRLGAMGWRRGDQRLHNVLLSAGWDAESIQRIARHQVSSCSCLMLC